MSQATAKSQLFLARLTAILILVLIGWGIAWYGFSDEAYQRIWRNIAARPSGPMSFRFFLQPTMAAIAALHDGVSDARLGRSSYLWTLFTNSAARTGRLREGLIATARIILLGVVMDVIYQVIVLKTFYPGEAAITAVLLAFVPYLLLRGPFCRVARWYFARTTHGR